MFAKRERSGDAVVGLFNTGPSAAELSTTTAALGLVSGRAYLADNLWSHIATVTGGRISAWVPSHGVALYRVSALPHRAVAPLTTVGLSGPTYVGGGNTVTERVSVVDDGAQAVSGVRLSLSAPRGWRVRATTPTGATSLAPGHALFATFAVSAPRGTRPMSTATLTAAAASSWAGGRDRPVSPQIFTITGPRVAAPFQTFSSAHDAPVHFGQIGSQFGIQGAGADLYTGGDDYSAIFQPGAVTSSSTVTAEVTSERNMLGYAKAGIMVRNDIAGAGSGTEGVVLYDSPSGGVQLEYDSDGGDRLNAAATPNATIPADLPVYLRLVRDGETYTGLYSTDGETWQPVATVTVPGQASTQDAGMFEVSQQTGVPGAATFSGFSVTSP